MNDGIIQVYYGEGHGKSTAAIGNAMHQASLGKSAMVIQFLKAKNENKNSFYKRLEPELKYYNFSKNDVPYDQISPERLEDERLSQKSGFQFARKVILTGACDVLVLDEVLGMEDLGIISFEEFSSLLSARAYGMDVICTGRVLDDRIRPMADEIYKIGPEK